MSRFRRAVYAPVVLAILLLVSCSRDGESTSDGAKGNRGTDRSKTDGVLLFTTTRGNRVPLSQFRGRIVFLTFFTTWKKASVEQIEELSKLYERYRKLRVSVIGVCMDDNPGAVLGPFIEKHGIKFPVYTNGREVSRYFGGVGRTPTTLILKRDGTLFKKFVGKKSYKFLKDRLVEMLSHRM